MKFILPNQETVSGRPFSNWSLRLNQRWEDLGLWQRRREILFSSLWYLVHSFLSALSGPLCPFNQKVQRKAPEGGWSFKRQLSIFAQEWTYRGNPLIWDTRQTAYQKTNSLHWCSLQLPTSVLFSHTWNCFYNIILVTFFSLFWWAIENAGDKFLGYLKGEKIVALSFLT